MSNDPFGKGTMTDGEIYSLALRRVKAKRGFFIHLITYILVNAMLWTIYLLNSGGGFWPLWVTFGWGIGVACNGIDVFYKVSSATITNEIEKIKKEREGL